MKKLLFLPLILLAASTSHANDQITLPNIVVKAIEAYMSKGSDSYIPTLLQGGPLENDRTALSHSNSIRQIESFYGKLVGYEPSRILKLSESTTVYYYVLNHEMGPVFANACVYKIQGKEIVTRFHLHTNEREVYHQAMLK